MVWRAGQQLLTESSWLTRTGWRDRQRDRHTRRTSWSQRCPHKRSLKKTGNVSAGLGLHCTVWWKMCLKPEVHAGWVSPLLRGIIAFYRGKLIYVENMEFLRSTCRFESHSCMCSTDKWRESWSVMCGDKPPVSAQRRPSLIQAT